MATSSVTSSVSTNNYSSQIDALINQYKITLSKPLDTLNTKKTNLNNLNLAYSTLKTKLTTFQSNLTDLALTGSSSKLNLSTATSSDAGIVSVTSDGSPGIGNYNIFVNRLAKQDKIVSSKISKTDTQLIEKGNYTFKININSKDYEVKVNISDTSNNQSVLKSIANAINSSGVKGLVGASVVNESSSNYRLMITAKNTGSENAIKLTDTSGNLLQNLGFFGKENKSDSRTAKNGSYGGYYESDINNLDALFTLDGTEYTKSSNTITDVIDGVTINLRAPQKQNDTEVSITTELDKTTIKANLDSFIKNYNDLITFLNQKLNIKDGVRADLTGDTTLTTLRSNLRSIVTGRVSTTTDTSTNFLTQIGIKVNSDNTIQWDNTDKFNTLLDEDSTKVSDLFNSTNGIAVRLNNLVKPFTKANGTLDIKTNSNTTQIKSVAERIVTIQAQIDKKAEAMRKQYETLYATINKLNLQQSTITSLLNNSYSSTTG